MGNGSSGMILCKCVCCGFMSFIGSLGLHVELWACQWQFGVTVSQNVQLVLTLSQLDCWIAKDMDFNEMFLAKIVCIK